MLLCVIELLTGGGWFDAMLRPKTKAGLLAGLPLVFFASFLPELSEPYVRVCAAPCACLLLCALLCPTEHPIGAVLCAALGGMLGWKLWDLFPLFFELGFLVAAPTVLFSLFYCRDANARAIAVVSAPFFSLLIRAVGDYTLFFSAVLELGSGDALCAQIAGILCLLAGGAAAKRFPNVRLLQQKSRPFGRRNIGNAQDS